MKLSNKKLSLDAFKDNIWIGPLLSYINELFTQLFNGLNNQITVEDNLFQEIKEIKVVNDGVAFPIQIKTKFTTYPKGVTCLSAKALDNSLLTSTPFVNWEYSNNILTIRSITGLSSNVTYNINLHIIYG